MNLPSQSVALLQAARDLVKSLPADAVLLLSETSLDWDEVTRMLSGCKLVAAENPAFTKSLRDRPDWTVIDLDPEPIPTQERMNSALSSVSGHAVCIRFIRDSFQDPVPWSRRALAVVPPQL